MSVEFEIYINIIISIILIGCSKAVTTVDEDGLTPDDVTRINDESTKTCSVFKAERPIFTQLFQTTSCTADHMSVTLVGRDMRCDGHLFVVGLTGADVGKSMNIWTTCRRVWHASSPESVDWCIYDCKCTKGCEQVMVLRWPETVNDSSWTLCDISTHCNGIINIDNFEGFCKDQTTCLVYGTGSWYNSLEFCQLLHSNARMIEEYSVDETGEHEAEAEAAGYRAYWLGGRRPPDGGRYEFQWTSSGIPLSWSRWRPSQPLKVGIDDNCIISQKRYNWGWDDLACKNISMFMCKIDD